MRIPKWRLKRKNGITLGFFFVIVALENFSWLIPSSEYIIPGLLKFYDIGVLVAIVWIVYVLVMVKNKGRIKSSKLPLLYIFVILMSSVAANKFFGQSYGLSIRQNRYIIVCMLLYYAMLKAMNSGALLRDDVVSILSFQAVVEIILFTLQYFLIDKVIFIHATADSRYGDARIRVSYLLALVFMYFCVDKILKNKYWFLNCVLALASAFILVGICKHRAPSLIMIFTLVLAYFLWKKDLLKKYVIGIFFAIMVVVLVSNSSLIKDALTGIIYGDENLDIRSEGRLYYLMRIFESPLVGYGEPNVNCDVAVKASGVDQNWFLADNGIWGFLYCHGAIGLIWLIFLWIKLYRESYYLYKNKRMYQYLLYVLFETGNLYMGMHWYYYYTMPFVLCVTLMDYDYHQALIVKQYDIGEQQGERIHE